MTFNSVIVSSALCNYVNLKLPKINAVNVFLIWSMLSGVLLKMEVGIRKGAWRRV